MAQFAHGPWNPAGAPSQGLGLGSPNPREMKFQSKKTSGFFSKQGVKQGDTTQTLQQKQVSSFWATKRREIASQAKESGGSKQSFESTVNLQRTVQHASSAFSAPLLKLGEARPDPRDENVELVKLGNTLFERLFDKRHQDRKQYLTEEAALSRIWRSSLPPCAACFRQLQHS